MKSLAIRHASGLLALGLLLAGSSALAIISEPEHIFFGTVKVGGVPVSSGTVSVLVGDSNEPLASFTFPVPPNPTQTQYVLRVPMDELDPRLAGTARAGEAARLYVGSQLAGRATIGGRGSYQRLDLNTDFDHVDLQASIAAAPKPVPAGGTLTYTLGVANLGPAAEPAASLVLSLPAGTTFLTATPAQGTCTHSGGSVSCSLGAIAAGHALAVSVSVRVAAGAVPGTTLVSTLTVSPGALSVDAVPANNSASTQTSVAPKAGSELDLSVSLMTSTLLTLSESNITYQATVTNLGPAQATGVTLTDILPSGVLFVSASAGCAEAGGTVTCSLGTLAASAQASVQIEVWVPASTADLIVNTASVRSSNIDLVPQNNSATVQTTPGTLCTISAAYLDFELLEGQVEPDHRNVRLSWRVTNRSTSPLRHLELRFMPAASIVSPQPSPSWLSGSGRQYRTSRIAGENGGVLFEPLATGIAGGQSDVFTVVALASSLKVDMRFWNKADMLSGQVGGILTGWPACFPRSAALAVLSPSACAHPQPGGPTLVDLRWTVHPWAAVQAFELYRLEPGNPRPVPVTEGVIVPSALGVANAQDVLPAGEEAGYWIVPLDEKGDSLGVVEVSTGDCPPVGLPPVPVWAVLALALVFGCLRWRKRVRP